MLNNIPQNSWSKVKSEIQKTWSGLDASKLEGTNGDVSQICQLVADRAGVSRQDAERELSDIIERCESSEGRSSSSERSSSEESMRSSSSQSTVGRSASDMDTRGQESRRGSESQVSRDNQMPQDKNKTGFQTNSNPSAGSMGRP